MTHDSRKPPAMLSLDLDDLWSYLRAYGDPRWGDYPSFLGVALPRILRFFDKLILRITVFVVGRDAELAPNRELLRSLVGAGHEIANHSFDHASDFHVFSSARLEEDFERSEAAIVALSADRPQGFRGPSYQLSRKILETLSGRSYRYDASTFPTCIGPVARAWQRLFFNTSDEEKERQSGVFGGFRDARRPLGPYKWQCANGTLIEIPVSTMPIFRLPIHWTYINYLASFSRRLALTYVRANIALCRKTGLSPSLILHATDFIGTDDTACPRFMPGMKRSASFKEMLLFETLRLYTNDYEFGPIGEYVSTQLVDVELRAQYPESNLTD